MNVLDVVRQAPRQAPAATETLIDFGERADVFGGHPFDRAERIVAIDRDPPQPEPDVPPPHHPPIPMPGPGEPPTPIVPDPQPEVPPPIDPDPLVPEPQPKV